MLITFSGIVGSGKSTNAKKAYRLLVNMSYPVVYLRFRQLSWKNIFKPLDKLAGKKKPGSAPAEKLQKPAEAALRSKEVAPLTLVRCLGYAWRMVVFRTFVALKLRDTIAICDRYFYDSFVHYHLTGRREKAYFGFLKRIMPKPDLALMLVAQADHIIARRQHYEPAYLQMLSANYNKLLREFPNLTIVRTDEFDDLDQNIANCLRSAMGMAKDEFSARPEQAVRI